LQQDYEKPPFDRQAGRAKVCIGRTEIMQFLKDEGKSGTKQIRRLEKKAGCEHSIWMEWRLTIVI
jgi:hypothetical protein